MLLHINPRNLIPQQSAADMSDAKIRRLEKDMRTYGFDSRQPIHGVMRQDGRIVVSDGHHRTQAAIRAGITLIPVEI